MGAMQEHLNIAAVTCLEQAYAVKQFDYVPTIRAYENITQVLSIKSPRARSLRNRLVDTTDNCSRLETRGVCACPSLWPNISTILPFYSHRTW